VEGTNKGRREIGWRERESKELMEETHPVLCTLYTQ